MKTLTATFVLLLTLLLAACGGGQEPPGERGSEAPSEPTRQAGTTQQMETTATSPTLPATVTLVPSDGAEPVEVEAEIADDAAEQQRGLMERTALAEDAGMLFVFEEEETRSFWMRNTLIPLSIAYIDSEGRIVDIQQMEALDDEEPHYVSAALAQYALEVNRGFFEERGIEVGDTVEIPAEYR